MTEPDRRPDARERTLPLRCLASLLLVALAATAARAGDEPPPNRIETGFEERVRTENWDNSTDFDADVLDARHQWRFRTRAWAKLTLGGSTDFAVGLCNESRKHTTPKLALTLDETVFETLYLEHRFADGVSLRVGRQDLMRGDGFILMDGGPLDGSRTGYFNAFVASKAWEDSRFDFLAISDPRQDRYLPPIHDRHKSLIEWDETAFGLYWSGPTPCRSGTADLYGFVKSEGEERLVPTLGGRLVREFPGGWTAKAELAAQAPGTSGVGKALAWGGQASLARTFACAMKPSLLIGYTGLSGDDPDTAEDEGWDPPFSRWPKWSDLYIYTLTSERGPAYWTNLSTWQAELRAAPLRALGLRVAYQRMGAFHRFPGNPAVYGGGTRRGDLYQARADWRLNDSWRGHLVGEWLEPGDLYAHDDGGWFFRAEVTCGFKRAFAL